MPEIESACSRATGSSIHSKSRLEPELKNWASRVEFGIYSMCAGDSRWESTYLMSFTAWPKVHRQRCLFLTVISAKPVLMPYMHGDASVDKYFLFHTLSEEIARRNISQEAA